MRQLLSREMQGEFLIQKARKVSSNFQIIIFSQTCVLWKISFYTVDYILKREWYAGACYTNSQFCGLTSFLFVFPSEHKTLQDAEYCPPQITENLDLLDLETDTKLFFCK